MVRYSMFIVYVIGANWLCKCFFPFAVFIRLIKVVIIEAQHIQFEIKQTQQNIYRQFECCEVNYCIWTL